jgi:hypothetical protein
MDNRILVGFSLVCSLALGACTDGRAPTDDRSEPAPAVIPGALEAAHKAYLDGDFIALGERVRDVILDPTSGTRVKENAYELLDKAYEVSGGKLPSAFKMPAGFVDLEYGAIRGMSPNGPYFKIFVRGRARDLSHLTGVTLRRLPDETVLDRASGMGKFDLRDDEPGYKDFVLEAKRVEALPDDGIFTLRLALDDGTVSEGWFIGHALKSSASPELRSPVSSASLADPNPLVSWVPFRSPEYAPFEHRTMNVYLNREGAPGLAWNYWTGEPGELDAVRAGAQPGAPSASLVAGDYWLSVTGSEIRSFGPVRLARGSQTVVPFHIVAKPR